MQKYKECCTDTRTFVEVWDNLTPAQRSLLRHNLIDTIKCTRQSVDNWAKGMSPIYLPIREQVANVVNLTFPGDQKVHHVSLFPNAR